MKQRSILSLAAGFLLALAAGQGATFNIGNGDVAGLIAAIQTANTNGEVNVINLAPNGLYVAPTPRLRRIKLMKNGSSASGANCSSVMPPILMPPTSMW